MFFFGFPLERAKYSVDQHIEHIKDYDGLHVSLNSGQKSRDQIHHLLACSTLSSLRTAVHKSHKNET